MTAPRGVLHQEARALGEFAALVRDPVYYGRGVPRGDGRLVLVLPGLFANDLYLLPLHGWLLRIGYRPVISKLAINAGCPNRLREQVQAELERQMAQRSGAVAIVGHSRGGMLGWAVASRLQARCSQLVLLGSPAGAMAEFIRRSTIPGMASAPAAASVREASDRARRILDPDCTFPACGCPYPDDLRRPLSPATLVTSIYSSEDQIVPPGACPVAGAYNLEVRGSHSGLVYNAAVYRALGRALAGHPPADD
jgi:triacylglycerol lipase